MARITRMKRGFKATINMGHYESVTVTAEDEIELAPDDHPRQVRDRLVTRLFSEIEHRVVDLRRSSRYDVSTGKNLPAGRTNRQVEASTHAPRRK